MMKRVNAAAVCLLTILGSCLWQGGAFAEESAVALRVAKPGYVWSFPGDHGKHSEYETEWWYYTGQLYGEGATPFKDKPRFGFQLTFFRRTLTAGGQASDEFLAHAAVTDIQRGVTVFNEREGGGALGVAGVDEKGLRAWSGDWRADVVADRHLLNFSVQEGGRKENILVRLLSDAGPTPWLQGSGGFSKKAECDGCASLYYSVPSLTVQGDVRSGKVHEAVRGVSWMDHEIMTNALAPGQVGWDWMGLMFRDGTRLMLFAVRGGNGLASYVSGSLLRDGVSTPLDGQDITLTPVDFWVSPKTAARYPTRWRVAVRSKGIDVEIAARVNSSEIGSAGRVYWEGPVASSDEGVIGYLEMTGYAGKIEM
jgi:predicted secreted hydrolase